MKMKQKLRSIEAGLKAAAASLAVDRCHYRIGNERILCPICRHDAFDLRPMLMNTRGMSLAGLDWLNESACALICRRCTRIELFATAPEWDEHPRDGRGK